MDNYIQKKKSSINEAPRELRKSGSSSRARSTASTGRSPHHDAVRGVLLIYESSMMSRLQRYTLSFSIKMRHDISFAFSYFQDLYLDFRG